MLNDSKSGDAVHWQGQSSHIGAPTSLSIDQLNSVVNEPSSELNKDQWPWQWGSSWVKIMHTLSCNREPARIACCWTSEPSIRFKNSKYENWSLWSQCTGWYVQNTQKHQGKLTGIYTGPLKSDHITQPDSTYKSVLLRTPESVYEVGAPVYMCWLCSNVGLLHVLQSHRHTSRSRPMYKQDRCSRCGRPTVIYSLPWSLK